MCTASRASFLTGQPPHVTGVIDQMQYSYVPSLSPEMPNMGSVMKGLGYKTAYFGKFEMDKDILAAKPTVNYSDAIQAYGFDVFSSGGDIGSEPYSGFNNDPFIAGETAAGCMAWPAKLAGPASQFSWSRASSIPTTSCTQMPTSLASPRFRNR